MPEQSIMTDSHSPKTLPTDSNGSLSISMPTQSHGDGSGSLTCGVDVKVSGTEHSSVSSITLADRLKSVEEQLALLAGRRSSDTKEATANTAPDTVDEVPDNVEPKEDFSKRLRATPIANFMAVDEYEKRVFSFAEKHSTIDVVSTLAKGVNISHEVDFRLAPKYFSQLQFLQVNSRVLCSILQNMELGIVWSTQLSTAKPTVIIAPFRALCYYEGALQEYLVKIRDKWSSSKDPDETSQSLPETSSTGGEETERLSSVVSPDTSTTMNVQYDTDDDLEGRTAYEDLECLLGFYNSYVKPWWDEIQGSDIRTVQYGDLCGLFQAGNLIVSPEDPQKVFRIMKVTGGRPTLSHLYRGKLSSSQNVNDDPLIPTDPKRAGRSANEPDESRIWTSFCIDCFWLDFDGESLGPVQKQFTINWFPGHRDITRLRPYPLRFAPKSLKNELEQEGRSFLEMTDLSKIGLFRHIGRTLTERSDGQVIQSGEPGRLATLRSQDVDDQIVIDFDETFHKNGSWEVPMGINEQKFQIQENVEYQSQLTSGTASMGAGLRMVPGEFYEREQWERFREKDPWPRLYEQDYHEDKSNRYLLRNKDSDDSDLFLLPNRVYGYILRSRTWACFDISKDAEWRAVEGVEDPWNELQVPSLHKRTLASLVERHFEIRKRAKEAAEQPGKVSRIDNNFDLIEGKGKGLIVLLHGAPGVGKTSTAESIATKYGKPILPITCGNLGLNPNEVEKNLASHFELAEKWGCIVLLDEADVFLASREKSDLARNALVSVFLRTLEYYTGILFLTTNRTGDFDEAFRSRVHVALWYPDLTLERTIAIWKNHLDRLKKQREKDSRVIKIEDGGESIMSFASWHWKAYEALYRFPWNGRQIRNTFQTAVALAEYDASRNGNEASKGPILDWRCFQRVALATNRFEGYLIETRGSSDEEIANDQHIRVGDGFTAGGRQTKMSLPMVKRAEKVIEALHPDMSELPWHLLGMEMPPPTIPSRHGNTTPFPSFPAARSLNHPVISSEMPFQYGAQHASAGAQHISAGLQHTSAGAFQGGSFGNNAYGHQTFASGHRESVSQARVGMHPSQQGSMLPNQQQSTPYAHVNTGSAQPSQGLYADPQMQPPLQRQQSSQYYPASPESQAGRTARLSQQPQPTYLGHGSPPPPQIQQGLFGTQRDVPDQIEQLDR